MRLHFYYFLGLLFIFINAKTKTNNKDDNVKVTKDKEQPKRRINKNHPRLKLLKESRIHKRKAMLYSMLFPGLGQIYNKDYWASISFLSFMGLAGWFTVYSHNRSIECQISDKNGNNNSRINHHIRNRDIGFIIMGAIYVANIVQAYISASMETFDVSDDLSFIMDSDDSDNGINLNLNLG